MTHFHLIYVLQVRKYSQMLKEFFLYLLNPLFGLMGPMPYASQTARKSWLKQREPRKGRHPGCVFSEPPSTSEAMISRRYLAIRDGKIQRLKELRRGIEEKKNKKHRTEIFQLSLKMTRNPKALNIFKLATELEKKASDKWKHAQSIASAVLRVLLERCWKCPCWEKPHLTAGRHPALTSCSFTELILDGFVEKQITFDVLFLISVLVFGLLCAKPP